MNNTNIKNLVGKKVVYQINRGSVEDSRWFSPLQEGLIQEVRGDIVKITGGAGDWYEIDSVIIKTVLDGNNINESGNGGETLING